MTRCLSLLAVLAIGCADARVLHRSPPPADLPLGEAAYRVGCGDVLEVTFAGRPDWDSLSSVGIDGRLPLGGAGAPAVEGLTPGEVRQAAATAAGVDPAAVAVRLADPRAGRIYLTGPEAGRQRVVAYRGPEPAVAFLWRVGAVKQGCSDLSDVYVVRPNVAVGTAPETFHVAVDAVVLGGDRTTDVILRPGDQVYVGETYRSWFGRLLPCWLRPWYRKVVGLLPPDGWPWAR